GLAAVFGQLVGGLLIRTDLAGLGWRAIFLINVPVGLTALLLAPRLVPELRGEGRARLDLLGVGLVTATLLAGILPLIEGRQHGWPVWAWIWLAATLPLLGAFLAYQRRLGRRGGAPLIDLAIFRERAFSVGLVCQLVVWMGQASYFLVFARYVQQGRGLDALGAGLIFTPIGLGYLATSLAARPLSSRLGGGMVTTGALVIAAGLTLLGLTVGFAGASGGAALLVPGLVAEGAGMGMVIAPLVATVLARVSPSHAGAASGVLSTVTQVGNALGVALIGLVFYGALGSALGPNAYASAFGASLVYLAAVALGGAP